MLSATLQNSIKTDKYEVGLVEEGYVFVKMLEGAEMDVADIESIWFNMNQLTQGKAFVILVDATSNSSSTKEAREHSHKNPNQNKIKAEAIIVKNLPQRILANFFMSINKGRRNVRVFNSFDDAKKWLNLHR